MAFALNAAICLSEIVRNPRRNVTNLTSQTIDRLQFWQYYGNGLITKNSFSLVNTRQYFEWAGIQPI